MPRQREPETDHGLTGICLPTGEVLGFDRIRSINYNPNISALRFSFTIQKYTPLGIDALTSRVNGVQQSDGRCAVVAHRFFRHIDTVYIQDADVRVIQL